MPEKCEKKGRFFRVTALIKVTTKDLRCIANTAMQTISRGVPPGGTPRKSDKFALLQGARRRVGSLGSAVRVGESDERTVSMRRGFLRDSGGRCVFVSRTGCRTRGFGEERQTALQKLTTKDLRCIANRAKPTILRDVLSAVRPEKAAIPLFCKAHEDESGVFVGRVRDRKELCHEGKIRY